MRPLTTHQITALAAAAVESDGGFYRVDMRVVGGLIRRGLVNVQYGTDSYYSRARGYWVTREIISGVRINEKGRAALAAAQ